ncbi:hypothetical protein [Actinacidiphila oryziradicis]|uniref:Uncharacterized protein n=1 Tax=Actinacidiphila oryziradicis TaxID=2571141 RepID=A0A4U0SJX9_9ACTN|nr:hypothetical protein [Actinacidiphila oryziradicis]TKA08381.1 hypothetical protein FCI23_28225 [Actinacidiphila oryziradicis]
MEDTGIARTARIVVAAAVTIGLLGCAAGCSGGSSGHKSHKESATAAALRAPTETKGSTTAEKQQLSLVKEMLAQGSDLFDPPGKELGRVYGVLSDNGTWGASYADTVKTGKAVEVDVSCSGAGPVSLVIESGARTKREPADCRPDSAGLQPVIFTVADSKDLRVYLSAGAKTKSSAGFVVRTVQLLTGAQAQEALPRKAAEKVLLPNGWGNGSYLLASSDGLSEPRYDENDGSIKRGQHLDVEVACAGSGTLTVKVSSGAAKAKRTVPCETSPKQWTIPLTAGSGGLSIDLTPSEGAAGGYAYAVRNAEGNADRS